MRVTYRFTQLRVKHEGAGASYCLVNGCGVLSAGKVQATRVFAALPPVMTHAPPVAAHHSR
jgi:hypothetical protein